mmetsp:Transcript_19593/g.42198  ORF Transcript_19593/g.42198 Transcript_19593/m.42198 type:complete len:313 (+) Transcript_19593:210-1148(+)
MVSEHSDAHGAAGRLLINEDSCSIFRRRVADECLCERFEQQRLHSPSNGPSAIGRVVAGGGDALESGFSHEERHVPLEKPLSDSRHLHARNVGDAISCQPIEQDDLVEPVDELGGERLADGFHHLWPALLGRGAVWQSDEVVCAEVGGEDDERVAEVDSLPVRVTQVALVHHLQQDGGHLAVRLLELVQEQQRVGSPPDSLGELAALVVADVAGGRAHEARDCVALGELRHVEAGDGFLGVEKKVREGLAELRLAHSGGAHKEEGAEWPLSRLQARTRDPYGIRDNSQRLRLTHHLLRELLFHPEQLPLLTL